MILPDIMPCWYYDKKDLRQTPSVRAGLDFETECRYRKEGARFIMQCGTEMSLGHNTIATGAVYYHRFYMFHTFQEFPRYVTACCCLFLAGKVEETPKKCRDIITTARSMLPDQKFQAFSEDVRKAKEEVMTLESILLQTIKFDLEVDHPYNFLVTYAKCLKGEKYKLQKMVQMAWNFVNDSLSTTVCLQWEPEIIAVALIHLASKLSKFSTADWTGREPHHLRWWDMFISDVTMEILEDICHQVLDLYQTNQQTTVDSPPLATNNNKNRSPTTPKNNNSPLEKTVSPTTGVPIAPPPPPPTLISPPKQPIGEIKADGQPIVPMPPSGDPMAYAYQPYGTLYAHPAHYLASQPMTNAMVQPMYAYPQPMPQYQCGQPPSAYTPNRVTGYFPGSS